MNRHRLFFRSCRLMLILHLGCKNIAVRNIAQIPARKWKGYSLRRILFLWRGSLHHSRLPELFLHYDNHDAQWQKTKSYYKTMNITLSLHKREHNIFSSLKECIVTKKKNWRLNHTSNSFAFFIISLKTFGSLTFKMLHNIPPPVRNRLPSAVFWPPQACIASTCNFHTSLNESTWPD